MIIAFASLVTLERDVSVHKDKLTFLADKGHLTYPLCVYNCLFIH